MVVVAKKQLPVGHRHTPFVIAENSQRIDQAHRAYRCHLVCDSPIHTKNDVRKRAEAARCFWSIANSGGVNANHPKRPRRPKPRSTPERSGGCGGDKSPLGRSVLRRRPRISVARSGIPRRRRKRPTPTKPPGNHAGKPWRPMTASTARARRPSMSADRLRLPFRLRLAASRGRHLPTDRRAASCTEFHIRACGRKDIRTSSETLGGGVLLSALAWATISAQEPSAGGTTQEEFEAKLGYQTGNRALVRRDGQHHAARGVPVSRRRGRQAAGRRWLG